MRRFENITINNTREKLPALSGFDAIATRKAAALVPAIDVNTANVPIGLAKRRRIPFGQIPTFDHNGQIKRSGLGQPVYWETRFLDEQTNLSIDFPIPPLITVKMHKRVVITPLAGRDKSVKEIIAADDYKVSFQGILRRADELLDESYPDEELARLLQVFAPNNQLRVFCDYLAYFGITHLVVQDIDIPPKEGVQDTIFYNIETISDEAFELELLDDGNV
jgi:hypothetical protein